MKKEIVLNFKIKEAYQAIGLISLLAAVVLINYFCKSLEIISLWASLSVLFVTIGSLNESIYEKSKNDLVEFINHKMMCSDRALDNIHIAIGTGQDTPRVKSVFRGYVAIKILIGEISNRRYANVIEGLTFDDLQTYLGQIYQLLTVLIEEKDILGSKYKSYVSFLSSNIIQLHTHLLPALRQLKDDDVNVGDFDLDEAIRVCHEIKGLQL